MLQPLGTELRLHAPTGRLKLTPETRLVLNRRLADLLGFNSQDTFEPGKTYTADEPRRLAVHREICVHLAEISTSENLLNGAPSTLLRSVPVKNERCGGGRTETFPALQYKRLASGTVSQLTLTVLDVNDKKLDFDHLSAVPAGIIGVGLPTSTILLELVLGDRPDDFVDVLPGFTLKWTQAHDGREVEAYISVQEPPQVRFTLQGIGYQADYRLLDISKIHVGPAVELKRLRFTPLDLSSDQSSVALGYLNLPDDGDS